MSHAYYNENDPHAAEWLRELIKRGLIAEGEIDDRSIADVEPSDLRPFARCHFFAGIGGWDYALQLAGWPDDAPVWTGSCPCQPFSAAGQGRGTDDERHLWPEFRRLIAECRPPVVFGEQVASKAGRAWLSGVFADLETLAYRRAGADLCAAGVGAPHIRQRLWWVADFSGERVSGPFPDECPEKARPWREGSEEDLLKIAEDPFRGSGGIPKPLLRKLDDGFSPNLVRGYGNAIVPQVAAQFIGAYADTFA